MKASTRTITIALGVLGLVFVGTATLVVLNWDAVSENLGEALDTQAEKTQVTLFRLGEVMSIGAALKDHYGTEPEVTYETDTGERVLSVSFGNDTLPGNATTRDHARAIAAFAVGKTAKFEQIDTVRVLLGPESYSFALEDLISAAE